MNKSLVRTKRKISFYKEKEISKTESTAVLQRKAETRWKIQLGGLIIKSGLTEVFSISSGEDLQLDVEAKEKATFLLGALIEMCQEIEQKDQFASKKKEWQYLGKSAFVNHFLV